MSSYTHLNFTHAQDLFYTGTVRQRKESKAIDFEIIKRVLPVRASYALINCCSYTNGSVSTNFKTIAGL